MFSTSLSPSERNEIRLAFYREFRAQPHLTAVALRRDGATESIFVDVRVDGRVALPDSYCGLEVRVSVAPPALNAVAPGSMEWMRILLFPLRPFVRRFEAFRDDIYEQLEQIDLHGED